MTALRPGREEIKPQTLHRAFRQGSLRFLLGMGILLLNGCGIYTFKPVYVSPEIKTISIDYFPNHAPIVQPVLSQRFTEALKEVFIRQSNLSLVNEEGHLQVEGSITGYDVNPVAVQGNETAAMNRLTVRVKVKCTNLKEKNKDFESVFSRYVDFNNETDFASVEEGLIEQINEQLTQDIFDRIMINW